MAVSDIDTRPRNMILDNCVTFDPTLYFVQRIIKSASVCVCVCVCVCFSVHACVFALRVLIIIVNIYNHMLSVSTHHCQASMYVLG